MRNVLRGLLCLLAFAPLQSCLRERYGPAECKICHEDTPGTPPPSTNARVVIIANTTFETAGLMEILQSKDSRPKNLPDTDLLSDKDKSLGMKARYVASRVTIEVFGLLEDSQNRASRLSKNKMPKLRKILSRLPAPALVIAFGTAAFPDDTPRHGSVYGGSSVFIHSKEVDDDVLADQLKSLHVEYDQVVPSPGGARFIRSLLTLDWGRLRVFLDTVSRGDSPSEEDARLFVDHDLTSRLTPLKLPPFNDKAEMKMFLESQAVGGSSVNVDKDADYQVVDAALDKAYKDRREPSQMVSVETTHGLIRALCPRESAFIFISGITNRILRFTEESLKVGEEKQGKAVSQNAGRAVAFILEMILEHEGLLP